MFRFCYTRVCSIVRQDREEGIGGGCATFIKKRISYRILGKGRDQEYIVLGIRSRGQEILIINYYNPCKKTGIREIKGSSWSR